uniref:Guanine nucleotide-binding protein subunit beta-like protein 1 isoform X4 n=1 Tax=Camelus bactrianus TaxID=9837 RepID=A0A9W3G7Y2_CAMBA|nr:guanine nucleotide-binding protein subunit beta-like protein 1 isoform X4 [Camelus bactrianus]
MTLGTLENVKFGVTGSQLSQICTTSSVSPSVGCSFNLISIFKALIRCFGSVLGVCSLGAPEVFLGSIAEIRGLFLHPFPEDPAGQKDGVSLRVTSRQLQIQPSLGQWQSKQKHKPSGSLSFDFLETRIFYGFLAIPLILYTIFLTKSKAYTFSLHCCSEISFYPSFRHHCLAAVQRGPTLKAVPQDMEEKQETWARTGLGPGGPCLQLTRNKLPSVFESCSCLWHRGPRTRLTLLGGAGARPGLRAGTLQVTASRPAWWPHRPPRPHHQTLSLSSEAPGQQCMRCTSAEEPRGRGTRCSSQGLCTGWCTSGACRHGECSPPWMATRASV